MKRIIYLLLISCFLFSCSNEKLICHDEFNHLNQWQAEIQGEAGNVTIENDHLDIDVLQGCTVWFRKKLKAPLRIEYTATVIDQGGPNDLVTDLNCFWMAMDPRCPEDILSCSDQRSGSFGDYHTLRTYYVGYGGHYNSKTRFRRYNGTGERPLLPENDLSNQEFLIKANQPLKIELIVDGNQVKYLRDGEMVFDFYDPDPYQEGWFAFRTVHNHLQIDDFKVFELQP